MRTAIFPGSFDPVTQGHIDIIKRAASLFDRLVVAVMVNLDKQTLFSSEERVDMLRLATSGIENVEVVHSHGLLVDFADSIGACTIVKGLRNGSDFDNEYQMALINSKLNPKLETVFLSTKSEYMYLSSTAVRSVAGTGGDITGFVPEVVKGIVLEKIAQKRLEDRMV